jgi:Zn finger protein HypA/HybF involved in hydrogenase expression
MDKGSAANDEMAREFPPGPPAIRFEVADVLREYGPEYRETHHLSPQQSKAMSDIEKCRTTALGGHVDQCDHCGRTEISYNSCRNRNCPKCRGSQRAAWVDARELELLPIQYFHLVFTLPHILIPLARYNPELIYGLLFQIAAETLQTFAQNHWDGRLGIIMILHTWGQTLNDHPHVHCIVTGGALKHDASAFVRAPKHFLFHVAALSKVFRGKFLAALQRLWERGKLTLSGQPELATEGGWAALREALCKHDWVVYAKPPFDDPAHLIRYLGRYVNRIAIANHRILSIDNGVITFKYLDNRAAGGPVEKHMSLPAEEFIRRFLAHIPPPQFRRIRYYGLLANGHRQDKLTTCRALLGLSEPQRPYIADMDAFLEKQGLDYSLCPKCGAGKLRMIYALLSFHDPPPDYLEAA